MPDQDPLYALTERTADDLRRLLAKSDDGRIAKERHARPGLNPLWVLVRCDGTTDNYTGGSGPGSGIIPGCFPGTIVFPRADHATPDIGRQVWLTVLDGPTPSWVVPTLNEVYPCILTGEAFGGLTPGGPGGWSGYSGPNSGPGSGPDMRLRAFAGMPHAAGTARYRTDCVNGQNVRFISYDGFLWSYDSIQGCCSCLGSIGSIGSFGSGSLGSGRSPCCNDTPFPSTLYLTITAVTGCPCLSVGQVIALGGGGTTNSSSAWGTWTPTCADNPPGSFFFEFGCAFDDAGNSTWGLDVYCNGIGDNNLSSALADPGWTCAPCITFTNVPLNGGAFSFCGPCKGGSFSATISASPGGCGGGGSGGSGGGSGSSGSSGSSGACCSSPPSAVTGSVSNVEGGVGGLPYTWSLGSVATNSWVVNFSPSWCGIGQANLQCNAGVWTLTPSGLSNVGGSFVGTLVSASCAPFLIVFNVQLSGACTGTFTITFTQSGP